jgi:N-acetyl sugar amidotransferase
MDTSDPDIRFGANGECHYVQYFNDVIRPGWFPDESGRKLLIATVEKIRKEGKRRDYDCIIGLSGGVDSSYLAYLASSYGLRILAVHVDGGWNSELAVKNIQNIVSKCHIDLHTHVVNWNDMRELQLAFFKAGVPNQDIPQDHAFFAALYHFAHRHHVKWVLHGGNAATEAILPRAWGYNAMDGRHLKDIYQRHGNTLLKHYPVISFFSHYIYYPYILGMKQTRLLNYIDYHKEQAIETLEKEVGFRYYGGKHHESRFTRFFQSHILPYRFGYDKRKAHASSMILSGQMTRMAALEYIQRPFYENPRDLENDKTFFIKKLGISTEAYQQYIDQPLVSHYRYKTNATLLHTLTKWKQRVLP